MSATDGRATRGFSLRPSTLRGRLAMLSGIAVFVAITFAGVPRSPSPIGSSATRSTPH